MSVHQITVKGGEEIGGDNVMSLGNTDDRGTPVNASGSVVRTWDKTDYGGESTGGQVWVQEDI